MAQATTTRLPANTRIPAFEAEGDLLALLPKSALKSDRQVDIVVMGAETGSVALIAELKTRFKHAQHVEAEREQLGGALDVDFVIQTHPDDDHRAALDALLPRLRRALLRVAGVASGALVYRALERPSDVGAVVDLLRSTLPMLSAEGELDPELGQHVSALAAEDELIRRSGGFKDANWVAEYLGIGTKSVAAKARRNELLALARGDRNLYPAFQFQDGQVIPGLRELLRALSLTNGWSRLSFLLTPDPALDDRTPIEAIHDDRETVLALAAQADAQGAA